MNNSDLVIFRYLTFFPPRKNSYISWLLPHLFETAPPHNLRGCILGCSPPWVRQRKQTSQLLGYTFLQLTDLVAPEGPQGRLLCSTGIRSRGTSSGLLAQPASSERDAVRMTKRGVSFFSFPFLTTKKIKHNSEQAWTFPSCCCFSFYFSCFNSEVWK